MKVYIGSDHAGFELKQRILEDVTHGALQLIDKGTFSDESTDYPDFAHAVADAVVKEPDAFGILICGSANGVAMAANKHAAIRCAICWNEEIAALARLHNDANIIALPARFVASEEAFRILKTFLNTEFEGGRHARRVEKIACS